MSKNECVFCKIAAGDVSAKLLYDSNRVIAFADISPIAPVHILIIPRKHISSMNDMSDDDQDLLGEMILAATKLAKKLQIVQNGYKLLIRTGVHGGQEVPHVHLHLLGGARMSEKIKALAQS